MVLGAWVRLSDAGLGCPDWPGCYGQISPVHASDAISLAVAEQGGDHGPVSMHKAWKEMVHRYIAGFLGLVLLAIAVTAWRKRRQLRQSPMLPTALLAVVVLQSAPANRPQEEGFAAEVKEAELRRYVRELVAALAQAGLGCQVYTRRWHPGLPDVVDVEPGFRVVHVDAGDPDPGTAAGSPGLPRVPDR